MRPDPSPGTVAPRVRQRCDALEKAPSVHDTGSHGCPWLPPPQSTLETAVSVAHRSSGDPVARGSPDVPASTPESPSRAHQRRSSPSVNGHTHTTPELERAWADYAYEQHQLARKHGGHKVQPWAAARRDVQGLLDVVIDAHRCSVAEATERVAGYLRWKLSRAIKEDPSQVRWTADASLFDNAYGYYARRGGAVTTSSVGAGYERHRADPPERRGIWALGRR